MRISKEQVEHVAKLARLEISEAEREAFSRQLSDILTYVEQLKAIDTEGVEPTATVVDSAGVFREDRVRPSLPQEGALANAPEAAEGFFIVPRIIHQP
jgi:aspartyl-tRNA(Asn)/glutamyl-tRNA(Gln) amidotransferase subunit C